MSSIFEVLNKLLEKLLISESEISTLGDGVREVTTELLKYIIVGLWKVVFDRLILLKTLKTNRTSC